MRHLYALIGGYCVGWTATYIFMVGADFKYFFKYLALAWSGGLEIPTFINFGALAVAFISAIGSLVYAKFWSQNKSHSDQPNG